MPIPHAVAGQPASNSLGARDRRGAGRARADQQPRRLSSAWCWAGAGRSTASAPVIGVVLAGAGATNSLGARHRRGAGQTALC